VNITVSVHLKDRSTKENWKEPFKKLKLSKVRAETEWSLFLRVHGKDVKRIRKLTADFKVETVLEEIAGGQKFLDQELWAEDEKI